MMKVQPGCKEKAAGCRCLTCSKRHECNTRQMHIIDPLVKRKILLEVCAAAIFAGSTASSLLFSAASAVANTRCNAFFLHRRGRNCPQQYRWQTACSRILVAAHFSRCCQDSFATVLTTVRLQRWWFSNLPGSLCTKSKYKFPAL